MTPLIIALIKAGFGGMRRGGGGGGRRKSEAESSNEWARRAVLGYKPPKLGENLPPVINPTAPPRPAGKR